MTPLLGLLFLLRPVLGRSISTGPRFLKADDVTSLLQAARRPQVLDAQPASLLHFSQEISEEASALSDLDSSHASRQTVASESAQAAEMEQQRPRLDVGYPRLTDNTSHATVCIYPQDLASILSRTMSSVLEGLPPWPKVDLTPATESRVTLAWLTQVSQKERLSMLPRVFKQIYDPMDTFLYLVDEGMLDLSLVRENLPQPLPPNVAIVASPHSGYYHWPRVQVLLNGLKFLLDAEKQWDFVIHTSESDYPLHSLQWIRDTLSQQRRDVFLRIHPRCKLKNKTVVKSGWYWWSQDGAVASCEGAFIPHTVPGQRFPIEELEQQGFVFASAAEWMILPRELIQYVMQPELDVFKRLMAMHVAADEIFWATLVLNIPGFSRTINPQNWFMFRSPDNFGHSPDTLLQKHLELILDNRRNNFFLRKVDPGHSLALLDSIDTVIASKDSPAGPATATWSSRQHAISCAWRQADRNGRGAYWMPPPEPTVASAPFPAPAPPAQSWLPADYPKVVHFLPPTTSAPIPKLMW